MLASPHRLYTGEVRALLFNDYVGGRVVRRVVIQLHYIYKNPNAGWVIDPKTGQMGRDDGWSYKTFGDLHERMKRDLEEDGINLDELAVLSRAKL